MLKFMDDYRARRKITIDRRNALVTMWCETHKKVGEMVPLRGRTAFLPCGICPLPRNRLPQSQPTMSEELRRGDAALSSSVSGSNRR
jgi:hypothetical protein